MSRDPGDDQDDQDAHHGHGCDMGVEPMTGVILAPPDGTLPETVVVTDIACPAGEGRT